MNTGLVTAWMASIGLVTWRAFAKNKRPPAPSELAATAVIYGTLGLLTGEAAAPAAIFGWGLVVAAVLNLYDPTLQNGVGSLEQNPKATPGGPPTAQAGQNIAQAGRLV